MLISMCKQRTFFPNDGVPRDARKAARNVVAKLIEHTLPYDWNPTVSECTKALYLVDKELQFRVSADTTCDATVNISNKLITARYHADATLMCNLWTGIRRVASKSGSLDSCDEPLDSTPGPGACLPIKEDRNNRVPVVHMAPASPILSLTDVRMMSSLRGAACSGDPMPLPLAERMAQLFDTSTDIAMRPPESGTLVGDADIMDDGGCYDSYSAYSYSDTEYSYSYSDSEESAADVPPMPKELPSIAADVTKAMENVRRHIAIDPAKQFQGGGDESSDESGDCEAPAAIAKRRVPAESVGHVQTPPSNKRAPQETPAKKKRKTTAYQNFVSHTMRDPMFEQTAHHTSRMATAAKAWTSLSCVDRQRWEVADATADSTTATAIMMPVHPPAASSIIVG